VLRQFTFIHIYRLISLLNGLIGFLLVLAFIGLGMIFFKAKDRSGPIPEHLSFSEKELKPLGFYEKIGTGPFKSLSEEKSFLLPDLKKEIQFLGKNTRPDRTIYDLLIHFELGRRKQSLKVISGQKLYLSYKEEDESRLELCSEPTPLWMMPYLSETGETFVEIGVHLLKGRNQGSLEERRVFEIEDLLQKERTDLKDPGFETALMFLEKGKLWAPDALFQVYGGREYQLLKDHQRIEFEYEKGPVVVHVEKGKALIWKEGIWSPCKIGKESRGFPLAWVKQVLAQEIEWDVWNREGLEKRTVKIKKEPVYPLKFRMEEMFSRIRQRTASRISCRIENKATILKAGDWIFHTPSGWRVLKSFQEIEDVLNFQVKGNLFVFDGIEKGENGSVFSGTFFDPMRTESTHVTIPMTTQRHDLHSPHKKKRISSTMQASFEDDDEDEDFDERENMKPAEMRHSIEEDDS
jgi:hypothetical protein